MSVFFDILAALDSHLNAMPSLPDVAWPNDQYRPTNGTLYLRPTLLPGETVVGTLSDTGTDSQIGVYQIDVFAPANKGKNAAFVQADLIADHFKRDTELSYNGRTITIRSVSIGAAISGGDWYQVPVDIAYYGYTSQR